MTYTQFLQALARGGWDTEMSDTPTDKDTYLSGGPVEVYCRAERDGVVIKAEWKGPGRKLADASLNGEKTTAAELAEVLA
ncbi:hypothetical protein BAY59_10920 [Prauserella coralliicola]|nr:hypothetical protein BAY59_10920 [Prauserella coralliicola]